MKAFVFFAVLFLTCCNYRNWSNILVEAFHVNNSNNKIGASTSMSTATALLSSPLFRSHVNNEAHDNEARSKFERQTKTTTTTTTTPAVKDHEKNDLAAPNFYHGSPDPSLNRFAYAIQTFKNRLHKMRRFTKFGAALLIAMVAWQHEPTLACARWYPRIIIKPRTATRINSNNKNNIVTPSQTTNTATTNWQAKSRAIATGTGVILTAGVAGAIAGRTLLQGKRSEDDDNEENDNKKNKRNKNDQKDSGRNDEMNESDWSSIGGLKRPNLKDIIESDASDTDAPLSWKERMAELHPEDQPTSSDKKLDLEPLSPDDADVPLAWRERLARDKKASTPSAPLPWERDLIEKGFNDVQLGDYSQFYEPIDDDFSNVGSFMSSDYTSSTDQQQSNVDSDNSSSSNTSVDDSDNNDDLEMLKKPITMDDLEAEVIVPEPPLTSGLAAVSVSMPIIPPEPDVNTNDNANVAKDDNDSTATTSANENSANSDENANETKASATDAAIDKLEESSKPETEIRDDLKTNNAENSDVAVDEETKNDTVADSSDELIAEIKKVVAEEKRDYENDDDDDVNNNKDKPFDTEGPKAETKKDDDPDKSPQPQEPKSELKKDTSAASSQSKATEVEKLDSLKPEVKTEATERSSSTRSENPKAMHVNGGSTSNISQNNGIRYGHANGAHIGHEELSSRNGHVVSSRKSESRTRSFFSSFMGKSLSNSSLSSPWQRSNSELSSTNVVTDADSATTITSDFSAHATATLVAPKGTSTSSSSSSSTTPPSLARTGPSSKLYSIKKRLNGYHNPLKQPRPEHEEAELQRKYSAIESVEERAFQILVDLGLVEVSDKKH